ncbi:MAG: hypothetical protein LBJ64_13130 [Deltaproteobacteria bacterium]|nr:hypothetical protein [Deltaproteobacteria bacterium]
MLAIGGAVVAALSAVVIIIGVIDAVARSEYQNVGVNTPVVALLGLGFVAGAAAFVVGLKKMKSAK